MISQGFDTKEFFPEIDHYVSFKASLDNYRVSTPYKSGTLFLDRCEYCNVVDHEIEYEVSSYDEGLIIFNQFLDEHELQYLPTKRKSERAFLCIR
jgi:uncharacterized protein YjbK